MLILKPLFFSALFCSFFLLLGCSASEEFTDELDSAAKKDTLNKDDSVVKPGVDSLLLDLIAYYPFSNGFVDASGNNHHGTATDVEIVSHKNGEGSAALFNGFSSFIKVKDAIPLRLNNTDFTINMWVTIDIYNDSHGSAFLTKRNHGSQNGWNNSISGHAKVLGFGKFFYNTSGGDDPFVIGNKLIGINKWHMFTVVYQLNQKRALLYVDGVLDNSAVNMPSPNPNTNADLYIGKEILTNSYYFKGTMDEIAIYGKALNDSQIKLLHNRSYSN